MRILAVHPQEPELAVFEPMPPLGMLWIAAQLRRAGHEILFIDQQVDSRSPAESAESFRPGLVLIGGTSHSRFAAFQVAASVREVSPEAPVVYGGPHASFTPEDTLGHVPAIDVIVHGEGEEVCLELAEWAAARSGGTERTAGLSAVAGVSYRENGGIRRTAPRPPIHDLDALAPPARDLVPMERYEMVMEHLGVPGSSIMTARGCPIACSFCSASAMFGSTYRARSAGAVLDEIEELLARGAQGIKIFDSTFTLSRSHTERLCAEIRRRGLKFPWECEIRVGSVDKKLLALMQTAGCYYVDLGIESGSQRVLDECIGKRIRIADAEDLLRWTSELGLQTKVFFTVGHPGETIEEARSTNRFIWRNRRKIRLAAFQTGIRIYPGTRVGEYAAEHKLMPDGFRWSAPYANTGNRRLFRAVDNIPLLVQPWMGIEDLRKLRVRFILIRLSSPRYVWDKVSTILRRRTLRDYLDIVAGGISARLRQKPALARFRS